MFEFGGGVLLHYPRVAFSAQHAFINGVVTVALNEAYLFVLGGYLNSTTARTHVTGGEVGFLLCVIFEPGQLGGDISRRLGHKTANIDYSEDDQFNTKKL